ncbi:hypothetical protein F5X96DRAFT_617617 [Biscogniauxia mediterranea]|nr:hypothetical protein F5X96DRAFT_617617 [Biscogniauxia mediterranea]
MPPAVLGLAHAYLARRPKDLQPPLALRFLEDPSLINAQPNSPLFAKLPGELRESIWSFALLPYEDLDNPYDLAQRFTRPGRSAPLRVAVDLLRTCRAVYVEAYLTPFQNLPVVVFDGDSEDVPPSNLLQCMPHASERLYKLRPWQFAQISSAELTAQQYVLEGGAIERVSRMVGSKGRHMGHEARNFNIFSGYANFVEPKDHASDQTPRGKGDKPLSAGNIYVGKKITHFTLRVSRTDWWTWSSSPQEGQRNPSDRLRLEPMVDTTASTARSSAMMAGYEARKEGRDPDFGLDGFEMQGRWGMQFAEFWPDLETLELVLETFAVKEDQLDKVVECAKLWTFPLEDGHLLRWNGRPETTLRWQGAPEYSYHGFNEWIRDQNRRGAIGGDGIQLLRQAKGDDGPPPLDGQVFVIKTLIFKRQRVTDQGRSFDV